MGASHTVEDDLRPSDSQPAWLAFADTLLHQEALVARTGRGAPPAEFAGLFIGGEELDRLMAGLPGMDGATPEEATEIRDQFAPRIATLRERLREDLASPASQFDVIAWNADLSAEEAEVFALVAAVEVEPARQRLTGYIQDNVTLPRPTLATLRRLFPEPHPGPLAASSDSRLRRSCLARVSEDGPWGTRMVWPETTVMWSLVDDISLDPALPRDIELFRHPGEGRGVGMLLVTGGDRASRLALATEHAAGIDFVRCGLPSEPEQWDALVRDATLKGLTVVLEYDGDGLLPAMARDRFDRADHINWVVSSAHELALESLPHRGWREVRAEEGDADDDQWATLLGMERHNGYRLDREQLRLVATALPTVGGDLEAAVRRLSGGHLDQLARRIRPERGWDDLVLPGDHRSQLRELTARYRHRDQVYEKWDFKAVPSAGVIALFAGPSGTGKTLGAEIVAGDLGLDVYKIDLSSVVSKYIGETEKNLERIFAAAGAANLVLFFDEADAIFGKRSEVQDAHDRYANIEVSYLLQRLESYDGLVILATNFQKNIDEAFLRRIHVAVEFPMPEEEERRAIWELSFPDAAPTGELDVEFLARQFKITGGAIRNAALQAAFLSAEAGEPITMERVMLGLKREFQKVGRLRTADEFGEYHGLVRGMT